MNLLQERETSAPVSPLFFTTCIKAIWYLESKLQFNHRIATRDLAKTDLMLEFWTEDLSNQSVAASFIIWRMLFSTS